MFDLIVVNYLIGIVIIVQTVSTSSSSFKCFRFLDLNFCNDRAQGKAISSPYTVVNFISACRSIVVRYLVMLVSMDYRL